MANSSPTPKPENLLPPWQPGQSGNPKGYSRGRRITDRMEKLIDAEDLDESIARTFLGAALGDAERLDGRKPNAAFFSMLLDRLEGRVTERVEAEHSGEVTIRVVYDDELTPRDDDDDRDSPAEAAPGPGPVPG